MTSSSFARSFARSLARSLRATDRSKIPPSVVLRHSEHEEDQEKGFVGNTILLTQPRPQEIMQTLPPADDEVSNYLSVCFNNQKMTTADVGKHKALKIDPQEYINCSELRKKVCPVFAEVR